MVPQPEPVPVELAAPRLGSVRAGALGIFRYLVAPNAPAQLAHAFGRAPTQLLHTPQQAQRADPVIIGRRQLHQAEEQAAIGEHRNESAAAARRLEQPVDSR